MKYAIISDIHSNLEALNTVLEHAKEQGCEKYVCGGDVVGYNANPKECMDIVRQMEMPCVMGNHDQYVGEEFDLSSFNPVAAEAVLLLLSSGGGLPASCPCRAGSPRA